MSAIPEAAEAYKVPPHKLSFLFYIKNHRFEYEHFDKVWEAEKEGDKFDDDLEKFVHGLLEDRSHEITSFSQFEERLNKHHVIIVYFGDFNAHFHLYRFLSLDHREV